MSYDVEDWAPETGSSVTLEDYKNERIVELAYKFINDLNFTKGQFNYIITQIGISTTLKELKAIEI